MTASDEKPYEEFISQINPAEIRALVAIDCRRQFEREWGEGIEIDDQEIVQMIDRDYTADFVWGVALGLNGMRLRVADLVNFKKQMVEKLADRLVQHYRGFDD